jgi:hypothetical protein
MAGKTVLMVLDSDDPSRGEIKMLSSGEEAARLAEDLLESGVALERIRVFDAIELAMRVAHRPIVSLGTATGEEVSSGFHESLDDIEPLPSWNGQAKADGETEDEVVNVEPLVRNGIRFSSLFKSDDV